MLNVWNPLHHVVQWGICPMQQSLLNTVYTTATKNRLSQKTPKLYYKDVDNYLQNL